MMAVITRAASGQTKALGNILLMPPIVPHPPLTEDVQPPIMIKVQFEV